MAFTFDYSFNSRSYVSEGFYKVLLVNYFTIFMHLEMCFLEQKTPPRIQQFSWNVCYPRTHQCLDGASLGELQFQKPAGFYFSSMVKMPARCWAHRITLHHPVKLSEVCTQCENVFTSLMDKDSYRHKESVLYF